MDAWMDGFSSLPSIKKKDKKTHLNSSNVVPLSHTKSKRRKLEEGT
jgi:hypothetical protein